MDNKISSDIKKFLNKFDHESFSMINIFPKDSYLFENLLKKLKNKIKNNVVVTDSKEFKKGDYKSISSKLFEAKKTEFYEATRNGILVWHSDFTNLDGLQAYYPLVFVLNVEKKPFMDTYSDNLESWIPIHQNDVMLLVNKNKELFKDFSFEDFKLTPEPKIKEPEPVAMLKSKTPNYKVFYNLPKPNIYPPDRSNVKWCQEFYSYINNILKIIVPVNREKLIPYILNKETMKIWLRAFTHFTTLPDNSENYEALEFIGDTILKTAFKIYYFKRYPYADAFVLDNASQTTQSDEEQTKISDKMGLMNWIILDKVLQTNSKIQEDQLEAFAGAIELILSNRGYDGVAVDIFVNMFSLIYDNYEIDDRKDSQTWLNQLISRLKQVNPKGYKKASPVDRIKQINLPRPTAIDYEVYQDILDYANKTLKEEGIEGLVVDEIARKDKQQNKQGIHLRESRTPDNKIKSEWYLDDYGAKVLNQYGYRFRDGQVLGMAIEATRDPSKRHAGNKARDFLYSKGITAEWVSMQNIIKKIESVDKDLYKKALLKAKNIHKDIVNLSIKTKSIKKDNIFVLYGENKDGYKYYLDRHVSDRQGDNYTLTFQKFINS